MPKGGSIAEKAQEMTLSVSEGLRKLIGSKQEHLKHLESRHNHLLALFERSHQDEVRQMMAENQTGIDVLKQSIPELEEAVKKTVEIEAGI